MKKRELDPARGETEGPGGPGIDDASPARLPRGAAERRSALSLIADALIDRALEGSVPHVKSLIELGVYEPGAMRQRRRRRGKTTAQLLLERWAQENTHG